MIDINGKKMIEKTTYPALLPFGDRGRLEAIESKGPDRYLTVRFSDATSEIYVAKAAQCKDLSVGQHYIFSSHPLQGQDKRKHLTATHRLTRSPFPVEPS